MIDSRKQNILFFYYKINSLQLNRSTIAHH